MLPTEPENPLYRTDATSECKYPIYVPDKGLCLSRPEADFVYTCLEREDMVTPFEVHNVVSPSFALRSFDFDFDDHFEVVDGGAHMGDMVSDDFPFSACTNEEVDSFFHVLDKGDKAADIIVARCYDYRPGERSEEAQLGVGWSIPTPFLSYTSHASESFKDNRVCIHNDHLPHIPRTLCIPQTVTYPADNSIKRVFYDRFDRTQPDMNLNDSFNDTCDIGTTFLGPKLQDPNALFHLEYSFPLNNLGFVTGQLVDSQNVECLINTGAIRSIMSRAFYEACPALAKLPRYKPVHPYCVVGNGQRVRVLYTIPVVISFGVHQFETFTQVNDTLAYEIYVIGIKSLAEIEAVINTRLSEVSFLNRSAPVFLFATETVPTKGKKLIRAYLKFPTLLTGMIILKLTTYCTQIVTAKVAVQKNVMSFEVINTDDTLLLMKRNVVLGYGDTRSLGFYNNKLKDQFGKQYSFIPIHLFQEHMNMLSSEVAKRFTPAEGKGTFDPYPWLDADDPRRNMTDEEILDKAIDLSKSALTIPEKKELMSIIHNHKAAFSLRDEIAECPNLCVSIDLVDNSPFFVCPFPIAENDKLIMDHQMNHLVELGILSHNTTSHTSLVMLITRKVT